MFLPDDVRRKGEDGLGLFGLSKFACKAPTNRQFKEALQIPYFVLKESKSFHPKRLLHNQATHKLLLAHVSMADI